MKVAVLTDVHANLPALEATLRAIEDAGCEAIYHTGDAIGIARFRPSASPVCSPRRACG